MTDARFHTASPPRLSIVIPTFNRRKRLEMVLRALTRQTAPHDVFEVVVVDDGSKDDTSEFLNTVSLPYRLRSLRQANGGPARARNLGVERAQGEYVLFLDDDVEPLPALVQEHLASHDAESTAVVVMGPLGSLAHYGQPWVAWEQAKLEAQYAAMRRGDWKPSFRQFWTGNASLARTHLVATGGFNPEYLRGEDVELGRRLHSRGIEFRFNPKAVGMHHAERSLESWCHAHRSYGRLEVEIFGGLGSDDLVGVLARNLAGLHSATRALVLVCAKSPAVATTAERSLRSWLTSPLAVRAPTVSIKVCSLLANTLYWGASAEALGRDRFASVWREAKRVLEARG